MSMTEDLKHKARSRLVPPKTQWEWNPVERDCFATDGPEVQSLLTLRDVLRAVGRANTTEDMYLDLGGRLLDTVRRPAHRPFGTGRKFPHNLFWPAHELMKSHLRHKYVQDAILRDPSSADDISLHLEETPEREIACVMRLCNRLCENGGVGPQLKCSPRDTYWRYMREHREAETVISS